MKLKLITIGLLLSIVSLTASSVMVNDAYLRATPPNIPNSAAFMIVMNDSEEDLAIVGASSNVAVKVELHAHDMINGMMRMHQVGNINLNAKSHVLFSPGGFHIMFLGLNKSLKEGDNVNFTLLLSNGKNINVTAPVKKVMAGIKDRKSDMHHGKM